MVVAFHDATLATRQALPLTWAGLSPAGSRQLPGALVSRLAAARGIGHPGQAVPRKAAAPLADRRRAGRQPARRLLIGQPVGQCQNDLGSERQAPLGLPRGQPGPQGRTLVAAQRHFRRSHSGRLLYSLTYATRY